MATAQLRTSPQAIDEVAAALSDAARSPSRRGATARLTGADVHLTSMWPFTTATADFSASHVPPRGAGVA